MFFLKILAKKKFLVIVFFLLVCSSCGKSPSSFTLWRFIDHLSLENIVKTPLSNYSSLAEIEESFYPSFSFPLEDEGVGENPYHLKRKLRLGGRDINVIFAPPQSKYSFSLGYPEETKLELGMGVVRKENSSSQKREDVDKGILFMVTLEVRGREDIIFQKYLELNSSSEGPVLSTYKLDLPYWSSQAKLSLITRGQSNSWGFWFNPLLSNHNIKNKKKNPNIILVSIDTLRADHLGCYGYKRNTSPHIDYLSSQGVLFENVYAPSPWTLPSHISLLTSLNGVHHQVYNQDEKMDPSIVTLADVLRQNQYFCSAFTGGGFLSPIYGFSKGFDSYTQTGGGILKRDSAERLGQTVCNWLDRNKDNNFFLFLHTYQPHDPYNSPSPYNTMFLAHNAPWRSINLLHYLGGKNGVFKPLSPEKRGNIIGLYDGEIRYTDEKLVKPLLKKLKQLEIWEQTMIILTSDHGEEFYEHKGWEHGHTLYDELLKVPLVIKFPEGKFAGQRIQGIVRLIDVMPTILDQLNINFAHYNLDGKSLFPLIKGKEEKDRIFLADLGSNVVGSHIPQKIAINRGKIKLILNHKFSKEDKEFFTYPPPEIDPVEVYNLEKDALETHNIAEHYPQFVHQLIKQINGLYEQAQKRKKFKPKINERTEQQLRALGYIR